MKILDIDKAKSLGYSDQEIKDFMDKNNIYPKVTVGGVLRNTAKSFGNLAKNIVTAPISMAKTAISVARGDTKARDIGKALVDDLISRYGGLDNLVRTMYTDPAGFASDVSVVASGMGLVAKAGKAGELSSALNKVSKAVDPINIASKGLSKATSPISYITTKGGKAIESFGETYPLRGYGNPKATGRILKQIRSLKVTPQEFFDTYPELYTGEAGAIDDVVAKIGSKYRSEIPKMTDVSKQSLIEAYQKVVDRTKRQGATALSPAKLQEAQYFSDRLEALKSLPDNVSSDQFYKIARGLDDAIPEQAFAKTQAELMGKPVGSMMRERNILRGELRRQRPELRSLGKQENIAMSLRDLAQNAENRGVARQPINFTKLGTAGVGGLLGGVPGAIAGFGVEAVANSPTGKRVIGKITRTVGQQLQKPLKVTPPQPVSKYLSAGVATRMPARAIEEDKKKQVGANPFQKVKKVTRGSFY